MHLDEVLLGPARPPEAVEQHGPRPHPARRAEQGREQVELGAGEVGLLAVDRDDATVRVDGDAAVAHELVRLLGRGASPWRPIRPSVCDEPWVATAPERSTRGGMVAPLATPGFADAGTSR